MNPFGVSDTKAAQLGRRMAALGVREADLEERFIRGSGPGGQNVNKVSTCVYLKHLPTGIEVKAARERSQALNRFLARRRLVEKLEAAQLGKQSQEQKRIHRIRKQKAKRSRRAKEKILEEKRHRARIKRLRGKPTEND